MKKVTFKKMDNYGEAWYYSNLRVECNGKMAPKYTIDKEEGLYIVKEIIPTESFAVYDHIEEITSAVASKSLAITIHQFNKALEAKEVA